MMRQQTGPASSPESRQRQTSNKLGVRASSFKSLSSERRQDAPGDSTQQQISRASRLGHNVVDVQACVSAARSDQAAHSVALGSVGHRGGVTAARATQATQNRDLIQRYLNIKGVGVIATWKKFQERYGPGVEGNMLKNIEEVGGKRYKNLQSAVESPDFCMLAYDAEDGEYYAEFVENERKPAGIGATRHVGAYPSFAYRPQQGFEELQATGLNNCVAVAVEVGDRDGVKAIALSHFGTPLAIDSGTRQLTENGRLVLDAFRILFPYGVARLRWNDQNSRTRSANDYVSGEEAANIAAGYLGRLGFQTSSIESITGDSVKFGLDSGGSAGWG